MPDLDWNQATWSSDANWRDHGEEWSAHWGGTEALWREVIAPRIAPLLPARRAVEIAPGHGRCTEWLRRSCDSLVGIDLNPECVAACRSRFDGEQGLEFRVNDGRSLPGVEDASVDLVFSFDSLVHVDREALSSYLREVARVLAPGGAAFLHHSNLGSHRRLCALSRRLTGPPVPYRLGRGLRRSRLIHPAWRAEDVSWRTVRRDAAAAGLVCVSQELVNWENRARLVDCFSVLRRAPDVDIGQALPEPIANRGFMRQARQIRARSLGSG